MFANIENEREKERERVENLFGTPSMHAQRERERDRHCCSFLIYVCIFHYSKWDDRVVFLSYNIKAAMALITFSHTSKEEERVVYAEFAANPMPSKANAHL